MRQRSKITIFVSGEDSATTDVQESLRSLAQQETSGFEIVLLGEVSKEVDAWNTAKCTVHRAPTKSMEAVLQGEWDQSWSGDSALFMRAGDQLAPDAIGCIAKSATARGKPFDIVIFDHLLRGKIERRLPGWDPHLLEHLDYVQRACVISKNRLTESVSRQKPSGLQDFLILAAQKEVSVLHIPELLMNVDSALPVVKPLEPTSCELPALSIIVPNKDAMDFLPKCLAFLYRTSLAFELIIVDNGSTDPLVWSYYERLKSEFGLRIVRFDRPFNYSAMLNLGVESAKHEHLFLLNNDVVIGDASELETALSYATRPDVGVVGSVLRYPDGTVQHAGMVFSWDDLDCDAHHILRFSKDDELGHIGALTAPRSFQAVTGAFQITRKSVYLAVGGHDESRLPIEHSDVDFCLRVRCHGLQVVNLPLKTIVHDESRTRSRIEKLEAKRLADEARAVMKARWPDAFEHDPYYNPYLRERHSSGWLNPKRPRYGFGASNGLLGWWRKLLLRGT